MKLYPSARAYDPDTKTKWCWDCGAEAVGGVCTKEHRPGAYDRGKATGNVEAKS